LGVWFIRNRSRLFVAAILYFSIAVQFIAALIILPLTPKLIAFASLVFGLGLLLFYRMSKRGIRRLEWLSGQPEPPPS
jgi:predicted neutral ceramidase superfamily lipid hydrolase